MSKYATIDSSSYTPPEAGNLRAYTYVHVTDIFGRSIRRRVSLGTNWDTSLESAKDTVSDARKNNPNIDVRAEYKVAL